MARHLLIAISCLAGVLVAEFAFGQEPPIHYFHSAMLPPGTVGQAQTLRSPLIPGYFQPIRVIVPQGARVSLLMDGQFDEPRQGPVTAGMQVGQVYQLKVTHIPFQAGFEVYPTIEIINRLYPPPGQAVHFPVPVELTQEEIELALSGHFVTRVIYLEDPASALAYADDPKQQRYFDVGPRQDPLRAADRLGRPMAIMRMGSRVPELGASDGGGVASPPVHLFLPEQRIEPAPSTGVPADAIERHPYNIPRAPLPDMPPRAHVPAGWMRP